MVLISSLAWPTQENSTPLIDALAVRKDLFYKVIYFIYSKNYLLFICVHLNIYVSGGEYV